MKTAHLALAFLLLGAAPALADAPAKTMKTPLGDVLVDAKGMTLYTFDKDSKDTTNCYDKCAAAWPPFAAGAGAKSEGEWTLVDRKDGSKMWAYEGKPLYTFVKDGKPGDTSGDGVGGVWHVAQ